MEKGRIYHAKDRVTQQAQKVLRIAAAVAMIGFAGCGPQQSRSPSSGYVHDRLCPSTGYSQECSRQMVTEPFPTRVSESASLEELVKEATVTEIQRQKNCDRGARAEEDYRQRKLPPERQSKVTPTAFPCPDPPPTPHRSIVGLPK